MKKKKKLHFSKHEKFLYEWFLLSRVDNLETTTSSILL